MSPKDMDYIAKEELFSVLESMKIVLPRTSKMSTEALSKRLKDGLNASQRTDEFIDGDFIDPRQLQPWTDMEGLMHQSMVKQQSIRGNFDRHLNQGLPKGPEQTLEEMQNIVLYMAYQYSAGVRSVFLSDKDVDDWAIVIRMFDVLAANEETPVFMLSYRIVTSIPNKSLKQQITEVFASKEARGQGMSELARRTFLRVLNMNAKKVIPQYDPSGPDNKKYTSKKWKLSFILPLGPVPMEEVGKLTTDPGCDVCGSTKNASRCTQCLTAVYCSPECQKKDWPSHRGTCGSLQGGTWTEINLGENPSSPMDGLPKGMFVGRFNMHESLSGAKNNTSRIGGENGDQHDIPSDIHGNKTFMVKFQVGLGGSRPNHMMMYDRKRSFTVFWKRGTDPDAFAVGEKAIGHDLKMYRWAMRTGPTTMKVCFDRPPKDIPPW